ncbi:uncharacterized protein [Hetaerina americana]|uniref:uncharacterized protein isoform X2 n=1 Tax=Hetaerina americana TaxID=62018 RepID=UPI003A7F18E9
MAWFDTGEAMGALSAIGRDANNFFKRTIEEIEKDLARVEVNVGAPGLRFGQSRNGSAPGTSEGGPMGSETKGIAKKAMACEGCSTKFSFMRRKHSLAWIRWKPFSRVGYKSTGLRECLECQRLYCTQCLPKALPVSGSGSGGWCSRERRQTTCNKCLILLAQPPSRSALLGLRTRDLQAFLASRKVPTHGCLEKDDLVNLVVQLSNYEAANPRVGSPRSGLQSPLSDQFPPRVSPDQRCRDDVPSPRSEAGNATPAVHSFGSRTEVHHHPGPLASTPSSESSDHASPSRVLPSSHPRPSLEDNGGRTAMEAAASAPSVGQVPPSRPPPPLDQPPTIVPENGDWVMLDVEERILPPYSGIPRTVESSILPSQSTTASPPPIVASSQTITPSSPQTRSDLPPPLESESSRTDEASIMGPPSTNGAGDVTPSPPQVEGAGIDSSVPQVVGDAEETPTTTATTSSEPDSTSEMNVSRELNPNDMEGIAQAFSTSRSPSLNRTSASVSQGSSPSKAGPFLVPRDIASSILSSTTSEDDLSTLSVKQLKELLTSSRVDYRGCCEKKELLERAQRLWREYKASQENLSDDTMCKVCMDATIDCVMLECGHMATCTPCGKRMSECPICRQYVVRIVRTFRA